MQYHSYKIFRNAFSAAFRQHRAESHCRFNHGYALSVRLDFVADQLDERNWVVDFGELRSLQNQIKEEFDHKTVVAEDDPALPWYTEGSRQGFVQLVTLPRVGCEAFAKHIYHMTRTWLYEHGYAPRVHVERVEVWEHGANGAAYDGRSEVELA